MSNSIKNNSIKKIEIIDRNLLDEENYFQSLIEEAYRLNLLSEIDVERFQSESIGLLTNKIKKYNGLDSSSIRVEIAQNIMKSNLYIISLYLKKYPCPDDAMNALQKLKISDIYDSGRKKITTMSRAAKTLYSSVLKNIVVTQNYTYNATIIDEMKRFFKIYDPDYEAYNIPITVDYPLCNPIKNLVGIEFINAYLNSVQYENLFCHNFSNETIHHLLNGYDRNFKDLVVNIFEIVLSTAIGCMIAKEDVENLNLTEESISYFYENLSGKSQIEIESIVRSAFDEIKERFQINNDYLLEYIKLSLTKISVKIHEALGLQTIDKVFIIKKIAAENPKVYFSIGEKMDSESYREIIEEIIQCQDMPDKIAIIKEKIKSFADLEDIVLDGEFDEKETMAILKMLSPIEIAVFCKKYSFGSGGKLAELKIIELRDVEQSLCKCLNDYISSLTLEQQIVIDEMVDALS